MEKETKIKDQQPTPQKHRKKRRLLDNVSVHSGIRLILNDVIPEAKEKEAHPDVVQVLVSARDLCRKKEFEEQEEVDSSIK